MILLLLSEVNTSVKFKFLKSENVNDHSDEQSLCAVGLRGTMCMCMRLNPAQLLHFPLAYTGGGFISQRTKLDFFKHFCLM